MAPPENQQTEEGNTAGAQISVDATAIMTSISSSMALTNALQNIPFYDGKNMPLKDFIQDVRNGQVFVDATHEGIYLKAIIGKLTGSARDSTYGKGFNSIEDLITHLKNRFAPGKNYSYYANKINSLPMNRGDTVGDYYDRMNILLSGARGAMETQIPRPAGEPGQER